MSSKTIYCVYRITNLVERKYYYGYKSSKIHPSKVLGVSYFSSMSGIEGKNFKMDQKTNPHKYEYKIVQIFKSKEDALNREILLHSMFDVKNNEKFYNKSNQSSSGFDVSGLISVKDKNNNFSQVSVDDPRYLSGELVSVNTGYVVVKFNDKHLRVSVDDPRYISGELKHMNTGFITVKDDNGKTMQILANDTRYLSGELKGVCVGFVVVKDKNNKTIRVSTSDRRYLNNELTNINLGFVVTKDINGTIKRVSVDDPRYLSGELKHINVGSITAKDNSGNVFKVTKDDPRYLSGELSGLCKGKICITDGNINKLIDSSASILDGWHRGRTMKIN